MEVKLLVIEYQLLVLKSTENIWKIQTNNLKKLNSLDGLEGLLQHMSEFVIISQLLRDYYITSFIYLDCTAFKETSGTKREG